MSSHFPESGYSRAKREILSEGLGNDMRPEPSLNQARHELAVSISSITKRLLGEKYGPMVGMISEEAVSGFLREFEEKLMRAKGDLTLVLEELCDRARVGNTKKYEQTDNLSL